MCEMLPYGEINVNLSISFYLFVVPTNWSTSKKIYSVMHVRYYTDIENKHHLSLYLIPFFLFTSDHTRMGQESDHKTQLVLEICSISTRSLGCVHTLLSNHPSKPPFIDWYCILGVSISYILHYHFSLFFYMISC